METSYNTQAAQLPLSVIWQNGPQSWTGTSEQDFLTLTQQLLALMGNENAKPWILVLDVFGPLNEKRINNAAWTPNMVILLAKALTSVGLNPTFGYHPAAENYRNDWVNGPNPSNDAVQTAMVEDMARFNAALQAANTPTPLPLFSQFVAEGNDIPRDNDTFQFLRDTMNGNGLHDAMLWSAGSYTNGVTVDGDYSPDRTVPDAGLYSEIYDFYNKEGIPDADKNPLVGSLTDPTNTTLGKDIFEAMRMSNNAQIGAEQLRYPERAYQIFNFSGTNQAQEGRSDAPVFGGMVRDKQGNLMPQPGVVAPGWDLKSFKTVLDTYSEAFAQASGSESDPIMGIWGAENGINYLAPPQTIQNTLAAVISSNSADETEQQITINKYQHNAILISEDSTLTFEVGFSASFRNGFGLYPLLDATGRILSIDGDILHPLDATYLIEASKLAKDNQLWLNDDRSGADNSYHQKQWAVNVKPGTHYALIADSQIDKEGHLFSSISAANPDTEVHLAGEFGNTSQTIGFEDQTDHGDNDFNDFTLSIKNGEQAVFKTEIVTEESLLANTTPAPNIDSIWMNGTALDAGTAYQLAELITGNSNNHDLNLVIDVAPPNNQLLNPTAKTHRATYPKIENNIEQYLTFLNNIDLYVHKLSKGKTSWGGRLIYHPQTEVSEFNASVVIKGQTINTGWAGFTAPVPASPDKSFELTSEISESYKAYIDWMGYFNQYMELNNQRPFSEFMFEPENSYWPSNTDLRELYGPSLARAYSGNPDLFANPSQTPPLASGQIPFSVTSGALANWDASYERAGYGADGNWAQIYDLLNDSEYEPQWPQGPTGEQQLNPVFFDVNDSLTRFNNFFVDPSQDDPRSKIYNLNRLIIPQANGETPATSFDQRSHLIFTYSRDPNNDPGFANTNASGKDWQWNKEDFGELIEGLRTDLPQNLNQVAGDAGQFLQTKDDLMIGVWDSNLALDSWFSIPDPSILAQI